MNKLSAKEAFAKANDIFTLIDKYASNRKLQILDTEVPNLSALIWPHMDELKSLGYHITIIPKNRRNEIPFGMKISWNPNEKEEEKQWLGLE